MFGPSPSRLAASWLLSPGRVARAIAPEEGERQFIQGTHL